ncbi:PH domain-containing protein [Georgenia yuyongxinii]|uniref:PH domain-containing protein n=1 Tax=Georgenia yuyongxinii TaxID=2589797 RepID=A0A552WWZ4_9MICO|nr:PH domain-containing protein [Georgenia yuyongxinii]TRW46813.1 PH domain-containing protein [Georgenia yuyongxinii]
MTTAAELHLPFRPRAARRVAVILGVLTVVGTALVMVLVPQMPGVTFTLADHTGMVLLAACILWLLWRQGAVRALPDQAGLTVRNFIYTRAVEWTEIVSVNFGEGSPWVQLDLTDGGTLAVMAIQRADGARAVAESRRLATLVALHEPRD